MRKADIVSGLFLLIAGLVTLLVIIPDQIGSRNVGGLPPDFFPRLLTWIFLGLTILLVGSRASSQWRGRPSLETSDFPLGWGEAVYITGMAAFLFVTYMLMVHANFVVAGMFSVATVGTLMGSLRANPIRLVVLSIAGPFIIYYVFRHLFMVFLPT